MLLNDITVFNIEVTQKVPLWLLLTATATPGHGGAPRVTSSVKRILRAGARIADTQFERRAMPEVQTYFSALAPFQDGQRQAIMSDISTAVDNDAFMFTLQMDEPWLAALLSNTC